MYLFINLSFIYVKRFLGISINDILPAKSFLIYSNKLYLFQSIETFYFILFYVCVWFYIFFYI